MAEQTRTSSNSKQLSLYNSGSWQDRRMQIGMWQKEKDPVTVAAFWVLVRSLQSKQESGACGNKPSVVSSNFVLFHLMPELLLPGSGLGEKHICHVQAAGARLTGNISGSICPWTDPLRDLTLPSLRLSFQPWKKAFFHRSGLSFPTAVMSTLSISSLYCRTAQQAPSADPFLLAGRASSLPGNCSLNYYCAKQVPIFLDAALTWGEILQHSSALWWLD